MLIRHVVSGVCPSVFPDFRVVGKCGNLESWKAGSPFVPESRQDIFRSRDGRRPRERRQRRRGRACGKSGDGSGTDKEGARGHRVIPTSGGLPEDQDRKSDIDQPWFVTSLAGSSLVFPDFHELEIWKLGILESCHLARERGIQMTAFLAVVSRHGFESKRLHTVSCDNRKTAGGKPRKERWPISNGDGGQFGGQLELGRVRKSLFINTYDDDQGSPPPPFRRPLMIDRKWLLLLDLRNQAQEQLLPKMAFGFDLLATNNP